MAMVKSYKDLLAWQRAMKLAEKVYAASQRFPTHEIYGLTSQIRRAAVSVPANIAEGHARHTKAQFVQFLSIAQGSLAELETLALLAKNFKYLGPNETDQILELSGEVSRMLAGLRKALKES